MARVARWISAGVVSGLALSLPEALSGQWPVCPNYIQITTYPTGNPYNQRTANVVVIYGEDDSEMCFSAGTPDPQTFVFKVNGTVRTGYFSVGANQATTSTLPLYDDVLNTLQAEIQGFDSEGNETTLTASKSVNVDWTPVPSISLGPYEYQVQDLGRCVAECFQLVQAYTTVPYLTMDRAQAVTLVYHGDRANPRPIIQVDVTRPTGQSGVPTKYRFQAQIKSGGNWATQTFANGEQAIEYNLTSSTTVRLKGQLADTSRATGLYDLKILTGLWYGSPDTSWQDASVETKLVWVNEKDSPLARGWTLGGEQRLREQADGSALITDGWGNAVYYLKSGGAFVTPNGDFAKLTVSGTSPNRTFTRAYPDSTKFLFNETGHLTSIKDRFNNTWTFTRDGSNRVEEIRDPLYAGGNVRRIKLFYGTNRLDSIMDLGGRTTAVTVDANRLLTKMKDPNGDSTKYTYASGSSWYRMTAVRDRRGHTADFYYNAAWKLDSVVAPTVAVYGVGNVRPKTTFTPWQSVGLATGSTSSTPWTPAKGDTIRGVVKDAENRTMKFTVDKWGQPLEIVGPISDTTRVLRETASGLPRRVTYPWGGKDSLTYNNSGLPLMTQSTARGTANYRYAAFAQVDSVWGDAPPVRRFINASNGGRVDSTRIGGTSTVTRYLYNARGQVILITDAGNYSSRRGYDATHGNLNFDSLPGKRTRTLTHDGLGRVITDSMISRPKVTIYYDSLNRVDSVSDGLHAGKTRYRYDGRYLVRVQDLEDQIYRFSHNALGWLTDRYDAADTLNRKDAYQYDRTGLLRRWTNRRGQAIDYLYDGGGRLVRKSGTNTPTDSLWYSGDFRSTVAIGTITRDSARFNQGLLLEAAVTTFCEPTCNKTFTTRYYYNARAEVDSIVPTAPTGISLTKRQYTWSDTTGALRNLKFGNSLTSFRYDSRLLGTVTKFPHANDSVVRSFTSVSLASQIVAPIAYDSFVNRDIELDTLLRVRAQWQQSNDGARYFYDALGRLDSARYQRRLTNCSTSADYGQICQDGVWDDTEAFAYDAVGNRTDHGGTYAAGNRIRTFAGDSIWQDLDGNDTLRVGNGQTRRYRWTAEGRLDSLQVNGTWHRLYYAAGGRLMGWNEGGTARRRFVWQGANLLAETNGGISAEEGEYSYHPGGLDQLHAYIDGTGTAQHVAHVDALGNVIVMTDSTLNVKQLIRYQAWGKETVDSQATGYEQRARWKGALSFQSDLGLMYMRARWYDPALGRFLTEDPIGIAGGINQYVFGAGDPINTRDPTGLTCHYVWIRVVGTDTTVVSGPHYDECNLNRDRRHAPDPSDPSRDAGEGGGVGDGGDKDVGEEAVEACQRAIAMFFVTGLTDLPGAKALFGAGRLVVGAIRGGSKARAYTRAGASALAAASRYQAISDAWLAGAAIGDAVPGYLAGEAVQLNLAIPMGVWPSENLLVTVAQFVPVVSTLAAGYTAYQACFNPSTD